MTRISKTASVIRQQRELAGLTQFDVARASGVDRSRLSLIENGHVDPNAAELAAISKAIATAARKKSEQLAALAEAAPA